MDSVWLEAAKQAPALVVLGWVVWRFLTFIKSITDQFLERIRKSDEIIAQNTETQGRVLELLRRQNDRSS